MIPNGNSPSSFEIQKNDSYRHISTRYAQTAITTTKWQIISNRNLILRNLPHFRNSSRRSPRIERGVRPDEVRGGISYMARIGVSNIFLQPMLPRGFVRIPTLILFAMRIYSRSLSRCRSPLETPNHVMRNQRISPAHILRRFHESHPISNSNRLEGAPVGKIRQILSLGPKVRGRRRRRCLCDTSAEIESRRCFDWFSTTTTGP
mmetsp:Transcript_18439/g.37344  ORF Transcript_18439/g.37344 Transcript_18439/m.37344 type:complete len:205 (+) Transcript_18439:1118-1732(+)